MNIYFVGRPVHEKGLDDFDFLSRNIPEATFYWYCFRIKKSISKKYPHIHFMMGLSDDELRRSIKMNMDMLVNCSKFEGFCMPIAEAMLLKKLVISYKLDEVSSEFQNHIEYVQCFQKKELYTRVKSIISKKNYSCNINEAKKYITSTFSPEVVINRFITAIH